MALVREQTMPTERPPLVGEVVPNLRIEGVAWSSQRIPTVVNLDFLDRIVFISTHTFIEKLYLLRYNPV
jgi:hypothetical protein